MCCGRAAKNCPSTDCAQFCNAPDMTQNIGTGTNTGIEVRASRIHGRGLFALKAFKPGDIVLRWDTSHLISKKDFAMLSSAEQHYTHPFDEERLIVVQPPARFVNHSCNNNTEVRDFCDVAICEIAPGEEITSSYSSDGSGSAFACSCGAENCRGSVN